MKEIYFCLPVHNEEKNLEKCVVSIENAIRFIPNYYIKTFVCLNDCKDRSKEVALYCEQKYPSLNIKILKSKKGNLTAQERILSYLPLDKIVFL